MQSLSWRYELAYTWLLHGISVAVYGEDEGGVEEGVRTMDRGGGAHEQVTVCDGDRHGQAEKGGETEQREGLGDTRHVNEHAAAHVVNA